MKLLVAYGTTEGQTRKIARWVADRIVELGHSCELLSLADAEGLDPGRFDGAILAGSVHLGHYQRSLSDFAAAEAGRLGQRPTLLLSVSLAAAGHDAEDWRGLDRIYDDFCSATGWVPGQVAQVAGAYMPSQYDVFRRFAMRRIIAKRDAGADPEADKEYTDWVALGALIEDWLAGLSPD